MSKGWTTPPVFSYGYPASVDDLNIIRNDLLYLYGEMITTSAAQVEGEVECNSPLTSEKTALILWIDHRGDNLYYRARIRGGNGQTVTLHISYFEDPYGDPADEMGEHTEAQVLAAAGTYQTFNNGGAAVDISGWGLTEESLYQVKVQITASNNTTVYAETNFIYEEK